MTSSTFFSVCFLLAIVCDLLHLVKYLIFNSTPLTHLYTVLLHIVMFVLKKTHYVLYG